MTRKEGIATVMRTFQPIALLLGLAALAACQASGPSAWENRCQGLGLKAGSADFSACVAALERQSQEDRRQFDRQRR